MRLGPAAHRLGVHVQQHLTELAQAPRGQPRRLAPEIVRLIQTIKKNVLWGAERIRGDLLKLGIRVSKRTIRKYMRDVRPQGKRGQTWSTFITNHSREVWACDFL